MSSGNNTQSEASSPAYYPRSLGFQGVPNARHLGGLPTQDGKKAKDYLLLRTAKMDEATPEDLVNITQRYNVKTIIDFRTTRQRENAPDPEIEGVENKHFNVLGDDPAASFIHTRNVKSLERLIFLENPLEVVQAERQKSIATWSLLRPHSKPTEHFLRQLSI